MREPDESSVMLADNRIPAGLLVLPAEQLMQRALRLNDESDEEAVHDFRVAVRTLRSNLRTFDSLLNRSWVNVFRRDLTQLGSAVGLSRDLEVMRLRFAARVGEVSPELGVTLEPLSLRLEDHWQVDQQATKQAIVSSRFGDVLASVVPRAQEPVLRQRFANASAADIERALAAAIDDMDDRLHKGVSKTAPDARKQSLHELRILAKHCRYAHEAVETDEVCRTHSSYLLARHLQELLGDFQDSVVLERWLKVQMRAHTLDSTSLKAIRQIIKAESELQQSMRKEYRRVRKHDNG